MTFSSVMVHLDLEDQEDACLRIAIDLAEKFNAKLIGIAAADIPSLYSRQELLAEEMIEQVRSDIIERLAKAESRFRSAVKRYTGEVQWRSAVADTMRFLTSEARSADLIVTNAARDHSYPDLLGYLDPGDLLMRAGRPVMVVPLQAEHLQLNCAMVAWKEAREARRAASDALPLLQKVREVVVAEVIDQETDRPAAHVRVDDVTAWLKGHGIAASSRVFLFPEDENPIDRLWEYGADFLIAGAYGHARLREWIFGGFTEKLLKKSPCCTFLSH